MFKSLEMYSSLLLIVFHKTNTENVYLGLLKSIVIGKIKGICKTKLTCYIFSVNIFWKKRRTRCILILKEYHTSVHNDCDFKLFLFLSLGVLRKQRKKRRRFFNV